MLLTPPLSPMLARPVETMPHRRDLQFDAKWDGFRTVVFAWPGAPYLQARGGSDMSAAFPEISRAAADLASRGTLVLDGELVVHRAGRLDFGLLQSRARRRSRTAAEAARENPAHLIVFDVLQIGDEVLVKRPLRERRALLEDLFAHRQMAAPWMLCPATTDPEQAREWLDPAWAAAGIEGTVMKPLDGFYEPGERGWYKLRSRASAEAVVGAVTGPLASPVSVLLGRYDQEGKLRLVARSTPLAAPMRRELGAVLVAAEPGHPWWNVTFSAGWGRRQALEHRCVQPVTVVEFEGDSAVDSGRYRHPVRIKRMRPELSVAEVAAFGGP
ncbi:ATP-dependent DNA ligase [Streptomyces sp. NPDC058371]|uniref:ATP-dependent DNA ligase n=1 Tax=Streptomyces sp. NPDC058371 TaxID=3346463 RepID=UPI0036503988